MEVGGYSTLHFSDSLGTSEDMLGCYCPCLLVHDLVTQGQVVSGLTILYLLGPHAVGVVEVGAEAHAVLLDLGEPVSLVIGIEPGICALDLADQVTTKVVGVGDASARCKLVYGVVDIACGYTVLYL